MSNSLSSRPSVKPLSESARRLVDQYAAVHDLDIRIWRESDQGRVLAHASGDERPAAPTGALFAVTLPDGAGWEVEIPGCDSRQVVGTGEFLAALVSEALRNDAESQFFGRELAERYEEITLLYSISEILGSVISLERAATRILHEVADTLAVKRVVLWVQNAETLDLEVVAAVGTEGPLAPVLTADADSLTAKVFRDRAPMILESDDVVPRKGRRAKASEDAFLSVPVSYTPPHGEPRMIGVINLIGKTAGGGFSAGDQKLIMAIASQIGAAVENARLAEASVRQERMQHELQLAHELQLKLLPSVEQFSDMGDVAARCAPADSVGGDFYHLFRLPRGCVGVMIADVSSHGFGAALIMALTMSAVAIHAAEADPPSEVLRLTHRALIDELESTEMYLTLFYGVIDPEHGVLRYANAGHSPAFRVTGSGDVERLPVTNPPFGIVDLDNYSDRSVEWTLGEDILCLFTDGLSEPLGADGEDVVTGLVSRYRNGPLADVITEIFALRGTESEIPSDDRTAVLVRI